MIEPLFLTEVTLPVDHPRFGDPCPVYAFLVHHAQGPVLVDTGLGRGHEGVDERFSPVHRPLDRALRQHGADPADVIMVINSHLHLDHCGNNSRFPGVPVVVQEIEYAAAHQPRYTIPEWVDFPGATWEMVTGETEMLPGLRVLPTPGHTAGHQSVVVEAAAGLEVIAAQAVYDAEELETGESTEPLTAQEAAATSESARMIKALQPTAVYFSHDSRTWPIH